MKWTTALAWVVIVAVVFAVFWRAFNRSEAPWRLALRWLITVITVTGTWLLFARLFKPAGGILGGFAYAFALGIGTAVCGLILAMVWTRSLIDILTSPLTRMFYDQHEEIEPVPQYSKVEACRKKGRYEDALAEVETQLERFPGDLTGILLMAEIQAVDLRDLPAAELTLAPLIQDGSNPGAVAALNQMADWRLSLGQDLDGARALLQRIREFFPGTEAAFVADQRLAHLTDAQVATGQHGSHAVPMREFPVPERVGEVPDVRPPEMSPGQEAAQLVQHLEQYPEDTDARMKLAIVYADSFHRMDLARLELEQLIHNPHAPRRKVVEWLNKLADLEIRVAGDLEAARAALQRIVEANPNLAAAEQARRRMGLLTKEFRGRSDGAPPETP